MSFIVVGPKDNELEYRKKYLRINTTSRAKDYIWTQLSPFHLGPVKLWGGNWSVNMENAWQYSKVYAEHLDKDGERTKRWIKWAIAGWENPKAIRYPMGRGAKPEYSFWDGEHYSYTQARAKIYIPLYAKLVRR